MIVDLGLYLPSHTVSLSGRMSGDFYSKVSNLERIYKQFGQIAITFPSRIYHIDSNFMKGLLFNLITSIDTKVFFERVSIRTAINIAYLDKMYAEVLTDHRRRNRTKDDKTGEYIEFEDLPQEEKQNAIIQSIVDDSNVDIVNVESNTVNENTTSSESTTP